MKSVFLVQHLHRLPQDEDSITVIGVYCSRAEAIQAVERLSLQPGFSDFPKIVNFDNDDDDQGFHVSEYELGKDHWTEGYETLTS
tara:strand:- start:802 stop:1056 length:255 start_codon:yes stop_codon:yes gene_type:complete